MKSLPRPQLIEGVDIMDGRAHVTVCRSTAPQLVKIEALPTIAQRYARLPLPGAEGLTGPPDAPRRSPTSTRRCRDLCQPTNSSPRHSAGALPLACSDSQVGVRRAKDDTTDIDAHDLEIPATTNASVLAAKATVPDDARMTVVFSTYQSLPTIAQAQERFGLRLRDCTKIGR